MTSVSAVPLAEALSGDTTLAAPVLASSAAVQTPPSTVSVLGVRVDLTSSEALLERIVEIRADAPQHLVYVNAHSLNLACQDGGFRDVINRADIVLNDGIGLTLAGRMRNVDFAENLNGSDLTVKILSTATEAGWSVFFYGAQPGVADEAARRLAEDSVPGLRVAGTLDGFDQRQPEEIAAVIRESGADVLIVALGQPKQERWLDSNLALTGARLGLGVGAFLDFSAGRVSRAPAWMNRMGIEWAYRLTQEPGRLWRRYVVGNPLFLYRAWMARGGESLPKLTRPELLPGAAEPAALAGVAVQVLGGDAEVEPQLNVA